MIAIKDEIVKIYDETTEILKIKTKKKILTPLINIEFREKRMKELLNQFEKKKIITGNIKQDIILIKMYEEIFEKESKEYFPKVIILFGSGVMGLFLLAFWSEYVNLNLKENPKEVILYLLIILAIIVLFAFFKNLINDLLNSKSRKYMNISRELGQARINLQLKSSIKKVKKK